MSFYRSIIRPLLFQAPAENVHEIGLKALKFGLGTTGRVVRERSLEIERFGLKFENPVGIAAGFDKNVVVVNELASLGFGFVEIGSVTFEPQQGNPKPRLFRLPDDQALINRLGFNNEGAIKIAERLKNLDRRCIVGVNIGKNKDVPNEEATENYLKTFDLIHLFADYVAVNISSPNTPNLRELQRIEPLEELLAALLGRKSGKPILVKIAPDLAETEIEAIVDTCLRLEIAGIIATNTTVSRDGLKMRDVQRFGTGGLSGRPLATRSTEVISLIYRHAGGKLPIIGVGGIFTADDAFEKIAAGASLLQAYTGFVYGGPSFANEINAGLANILERRGFKCLDDAIGSAR